MNDRSNHRIFLYESLYGILLALILAACTATVAVACFVPAFHLWEASAAIRWIVGLGCAVGFVFLLPIGEDARNPRDATDPLTLLFYGSAPLLSFLYCIEEPAVIPPPHFLILAGGVSTALATLLWLLVAIANLADRWIEHRERSQLIV